jgi:glycosyltransferase involved in cell wall biosynthesis
MTRFRLAYLVSHPIQYQAPLLRLVDAHPEIALHVYYMDDPGSRLARDREFGVPVQWDIPLREGYISTILRNRSPIPNSDRFLRFIHPEMLRVLTRERYDALIVHGYAHATEWLAFLGARLSRTPILLRGESTLLGRRRRWVESAKRLLLGRILLPRIQGVLAIGTLNREFYRAYGVPDERIFSVPYAVDNSRFQAEAERLRRTRTALRDAQGWPANLPVILFSGKLITKKRPMDLLLAYAKVVCDRPAGLVFLGEGTHRARLEAEAKRRHLPMVTVTGFVNQTEIPRWYAAADIFVLPSGYEPWGLALNEAMCFDLPVIASDAVGAAPDLVRHEENGFVYPAGDIDALAEALRRLLDDSERRLRMGARSRAIVTAFSYEADVQGILEALRSVARPAPAHRGARREERPLPETRSGR